MDQTFVGWDGVNIGTAWHIKCLNSAGNNCVSGGVPRECDCQSMVRVTCSSKNTMGPIN